MKGFLLVSGIMFWLGSSLDSKIANFIYLFWIIAFLLTWFGWSLFYSFMCLIATASYKYMSIESNDYLQSTTLPWLFGISITIVILGLGIKNRHLLGWHPFSS